MTINSESKPALATFAQLRNDPLSGEPVLVFPEGFLVLDPAAHGILTRCDGNTTLGEIITALGEEFDGDSAHLSAYALTTLRQLAERDLVVFMP